MQGALPVVIFVVGFLGAWMIYPYTQSRYRRYATSALDFGLMRVVLAAGVGYLGVRFFNGDF